ncbi:ABC transporter permease [Chitinophaga sp. 30R24]|uniref:ABC transporter permease n=1 Tax=Chitinophaga sp. 30R24 TaxID=3248838 RepID=UPI003B902D64
MIKAYMRITWRYLLKNRMFTSLNLIGLSTGMASALLICLWVNDEWSMDKFHKQGRHLYQVMENRAHADGINTTPETSPLLGEAITDALPEVEMAVTTTPVSWFQKMAISVGDHPVKATGIFAGKSYFDIFSYPVLQGNSRTVLANRNNVVISAKLANTLFGGTTNVVGKTISINLQI